MTYEHKREFPGPDRLARIVGEIRRLGCASVGNLALLTQVSPATIRRDLAALEADGVIHRTRGGAEIVRPVLNDLFTDSSFREQVGRMASEKARIGVAASSLISDGQVVAFGPGTTTTAVACGILPNRRLTVVTNAVNIALELSRRPGLKLFVTGGYLREGWFSLVGQTAVDSLRERIFDTAIVSVNGIDPVHGFTDDHHEETIVNRTMFRQAKRRIVVADHTKFQQLAACRLCDVDDVHTLVTDSGAPEESLKPFLEKGIEVIRA